MMYTKTSILKFSFFVLFAARIASAYEMTLYPCREGRLPAEDTPTPDSCETKLERDFKVVKFLAHGDAGGTVLVRDNQGHELVAKYMSYGSNETKVACILSAQKNVTNQQGPETFIVASPYDLFMYTYSWGRCDRVPKDWLPKAEEIGNTYSDQKFKAMIAKPGRDGFVFMFSEYILGKPIKEFNRQAPDDVRSILFEAIYGLMALRKDVKFSHDDLTNGNNILISESSAPRTYKIGPNYYKTQSKYLPKYIDFGRSRVNQEVRSQDIEGIRAIIERLIKEREHEFTELSALIKGKVFERAIGTDSSDWCSLRNLLEEPYFSSLRTK